MGRKKGGKNVGYFYRKGRGWGRKFGPKFVPLLDCDGNHLKDPATPTRVLNEAYERSDLPRVTVKDLANDYLTKARIAPSTYDMRLKALTRFCGQYGKLYPERLPPLDSLARIEAQAVRRMLNWARERGIHSKVKVTVPPGGSRVTYVTPEQEAALLATANPALAAAIRVMIRTGMRPGEFIALSPQHVTDHGKRMEFRFKPEEIKTRKARIVRVTDPEIMELVRQSSKAPFFRNRNGGKWKRGSLARAFNRAMKRTGLTFDDDCCLYSCRHTFAKRVLTGYWTGKPQSIEVLATLMGNSPAICRKFYLEWADEYTEPLWQAV